MSMFNALILLGLTGELQSAVFDVGGRGESRKNWLSGAR